MVLLNVITRIAFSVMELMHIYLIFFLWISILHDCIYSLLVFRPVFQQLFNNFMKLFSIYQVFYILPFNCIMGNIFFSSSHLILTKKLWDFCQHWKFNVILVKVKNIKQCLQSSKARKFFHYFLNNLLSWIAKDSYQNKTQNYDFRKNYENSKYLPWPQLWGYFWTHESWIRELETGSRKSFRRAIWSFALQ